MSQRRHRKKCVKRPGRGRRLGLRQLYHLQSSEVSRTAVCGPDVQEYSASVTQRQLKLVSSHPKNVATNTSNVPGRPQTGLNVQKKITFHGRWCSSSIIIF